jgi:four helix bundle protein
MNDDNVTLDAPSDPTRRYVFDHHRLHAYDVALEALVLGEQLAKSVPRGNASFVDQLRRALAGAFLQTTEAAARTGADRLARFRAARGEVCEAAGALEAMGRLGLVAGESAERELALLHRLCCMLTKLARIR